MSERLPPTEPKAAGPQKIYDGIYPYRGNFDREAVAFCRLRLFARDGKEPMVVLTELPANPSTSVTNMIEILTAEVITRYLPHRLEVIGEDPEEHGPTGRVVGTIDTTDIYKTLSRMLL